MEFFANVSYSFLKAELNFAELSNFHSLKFINYDLKGT